MTREEAIKLLELLEKCATIEESKECCKLAIEALERPEIVRCKDCSYSEKVECRTRTIYCNQLRDYFLNDFYCGNARRREE